MRLRYYPGRYALVKRYRRRKPRVRVYRYGVVGGVVVYTAKPKRRNGEFPGCWSFAVTLGEAQLNRETFDPSARAFVQVSRGVWQCVR
jgi:uncharacterized membrane protein